jgi:hypothetical protein
MFGSLEKRSLDEIAYKNSITTEDVEMKRFTSKEQNEEEDNNSDHKEELKEVED